MENADVWIALVRGFRGAKIAPGLSHDEFQEIEAKLGFRFPDDLRAFLSRGLPVGEKWPEWRSLVEAPGSQAAEHLRGRLAWPLEGMLFDVEQNAFWDPAWGVRPENLAEAKQLAANAVKAAPVLIPVYAHRYLPAEPTVAGNPVFSVWQMDIIIYGADLYRYFLAETGGWQASLAGAEAPEREIRCWTRWMNAAWT